MGFVPWAAVVAVASVFGGPVAPAQVASCLRPPVAAPVIDPYREPACEFCAGHRGITYGTSVGASVRAVAAGTVTFSGSVAGTRYVVVAHALGGLRATYGGLAATPLGAGDVVGAGAEVGTAGGAVHLGLRRGDVYVDPTGLLGRLVSRPRLVPSDGTPPRAAAPPALDCAGTGDPADGPALGDPTVAAAALAAGGAGVLPLTGVGPAAWAAPHHDYPAVDVLVPTGTPVRAWRSGTVRNVHDGRGTCGVGVTVVDATWPDVTWTYCHLSRLDVGAGDVVRMGAHVGRSGDTGRSGAPHLHLEVRVGGRQVCPQRALRSIAATGAMVDPHRLPVRGCSFGT